MKKSLLIFFLSPLMAAAQQKNLPLNREWALDVEKWDVMIQDGKDTLKYYREHYKNLHAGDIQSCFKPYNENFENFMEYTYRSFTYEDYYDWAKKKIFDESLLVIKDTTDKFLLTADPLFNIEFGRDLEDKKHEKLYKNTRGVLVKGDVGEKFSFETSFYENQATFAQYIDTFNREYRVVPGQGRWKKFKLNGYDYAMASGYISYSPGKYFNFQTGHGKHFVGDGYRSLLLSDNAFNYPFVRITTTWKKIQYTNLYTVFMNLTDGDVNTPPGTERLFQKKAGSFQFLSWNIHKQIQLGLFQGLIWQSTDTLNRMNLHLSYINPIIFGNAIQFSLGSPYNVLLGSTFKIKMTNSVALYGQYMLDDFAEKRWKESVSNKQGFQVGLKYFDAFNVQNFHLQAEYNRVRPYSYAAKNSAQSYSHYNQPLAHPLGANFREIVTIINYRSGDFFGEIKINHAQIGKDSIDRNYGNDVLLSQNTAFYGVNSNINRQNQGVKTTVTFFDFKLGYLVNPSTNLNVVAGISMRTEKNSAKSVTNFVYLGIRTSLTNVYYDF